MTVTYSSSGPVVVVGWYDGPTAGVRPVGEDVAEYFEVLAWSDDQDLKLFGSTMVAMLDYERICAIGIEDAARASNRYIFLGPQRQDSKGSIVANLIARFQTQLKADAQFFLANDVYGPREPISSDSDLAQRHAGAIGTGVVQRLHQLP